MADDDRIVFTRRSADRIANAVRTVEGLQEPAIGLKFEGPRSQAGGGKGIKICTFSGAWDIDTFKTVTFKYQTNTPNTVTAVNLFLDLPADGTKQCAIAKDGTAWHLIQWQWVTISCTTSTSSP